MSCQTLLAAGLPLLLQTDLLGGVESAIGVAVVVELAGQQSPRPPLPGMPGSI